MKQCTTQQCVSRPTSKQAWPSAPTLGRAEQASKLFSSRALLDSNERSLPQDKRGTHIHTADPGYTTSQWLKAPATRPKNDDFIKQREQAPAPLIYDRDTII
jgi:hypothetical protein